MRDCGNCRYRLPQMASGAGLKPECQMTTCLRACRLHMMPHSIPRRKSKLHMSENTHSLSIVQMVPEGAGQGRSEVCQRVSVAKHLMDSHTYD